jgi:hypothetical protein
MTTSNYRAFTLGSILRAGGMLRGSSDLLQRSVKVLVPVIEVMAAAPREVWTLDANQDGDGVCYRCRNGTPVPTGKSH